MDITTIVFTIIPIAAMVAYARLWVDVWRDYRAYDPNAEHALFLLTVLVLVSVGNVLIGVTALWNNAPTSWGSIFVRGVLAMGAFYLTMRRPDRRGLRH